MSLAERIKLERERFALAKRRLRGNQISSSSANDEAELREEKTNSVARSIPSRWLEEQMHLKAKKTKEHNSNQDYWNRETGDSNNRVSLHTRNGDSRLTTISQRQRFRSVSNTTQNKYKTPRKVMKNKNTDAPSYKSSSKHYCRTLKEFCKHSFILKVPHIVQCKLNSKWVS